jgi:lipopolysaccharide assembly protein A
MQFLKILLLVLVAFGAALFTIGNMSWVPINLWGGLVAEINLPFMLFLTFLTGLVPTWLYYRVARWRLAQRLTAAERVIADLRPVPVPMGADPLPSTPSSVVPPSATAEQQPFTLTP